MPMGSWVIRRRVRMVHLLNKSLSWRVSAEVEEKWRLLSLRIRLAAFLRPSSLSEPHLHIANMPFSKVAPIMITFHGINHKSIISC